MSELHRKYTELRAENGELRLIVAEHDKSCASLRSMQTSLEAEAEANQQFLSDIQSDLLMLAVCPNGYSYFHFLFASLRLIYHTYRTQRISKILVIYLWLKFLSYGFVLVSEFRSMLQTKFDGLKTNAQQAAASLELAQDDNQCLLEELNQYVGLGFALVNRRIFRLKNLYDELLAKSADQLTAQNAAQEAQKQICLLEAQFRQASEELSKERERIAAAEASLQQHSALKGKFEDLEQVRSNSHFRT